MKTKEEIKIFFDNELLAELQEFDNKRIYINKNTLIRKILYLSGFVFVVFLTFSGFSELITSLCIILGFPASVYYLLTVNQKKNEVFSKICSEYKWKLVPQILEKIFDNVRYIPNQFISLNALRESEIFGEFFNLGKGEDYFKCEIKDVIFQFSEISVTNSPVLRKPKLITGIFCVSDFNKNFTTRTLILPASLFSFKKNTNHSFSNLVGFEKVHLEDPLFNKEFVVYAEDQVESRYIITPSLMTKMLNLKDVFNSDIVFSFSHQRLNVFIETSEDLFEPPKKKLYADFEHFYKNINYFILFASIVEELNLNVKIWGRE